MKGIPIVAMGLALVGCRATPPAGGAPDTAAPAPARQGGVGAADLSERDSMVHVYIQIDPARVTREKLAAMGVEVGTIAGDIVTARVPEGALDRVRALDGVRHVEVAGTVHFRSDPEDPPKDSGKRD